MSKKVTTPATELIINVPLNKILPDPDNHRQSLNEDADFELAQSIADKGILQPITVRPCTDHKEFDYYVVFGHRRLRASKLTKRTTIPCIVRQYSKDDVLEIQILENLQREDITPMDEAFAFQNLLKKESLNWLCAKIHKSPKYVNDRLKLINLITPGHQLLNANKLPLSHAILISKLNAEDQKKVLDKCFLYVNFEHTLSAEDIDDPMTVIDITLDDLKEKIDELFTELSKAPFDTADETLHVEAGACTDCPFRTKNSTLLFADITDEDKCTKVSCFKEKVDLHLKRAQLMAKEEHGTKVLAAQLEHNSNSEVKVSGQKVRFTDKPAKGLTPVIITKASDYNQNQLGKTVYVNLEPEKEKPASKSKPVIDNRNQEWNENQSKDINTIYEFVMDNDINTVDMIKLVMKELLIRSDLENLVTLCNHSHIETGVPKGEEYNYAKSVKWDDKAEKKSELIKKIIPYYEQDMHKLLALAIFTNEYSDELVLNEDEEEDYFDENISLTKFLRAIKFIPAVKEDSKK